MKKAFTLVELMIVVAILGILAAIVLPEFTTQTQLAKEAAAKDCLRILRNSIELYAVQHNNVPPGYLNGDTSANPSNIGFLRQLTWATNALGQHAEPGTAGYPLGPYLPKLPESPFNGIHTTRLVADLDVFPTEPVLPELYGWIFQPSTRTLKLNHPGTDSAGIDYFDY